MQNLQCQCENILEIEVPESVDLNVQTETLASLRDGSFLTYTCTRCGSKLRPEATIRLTGGPFAKPILLVSENERMLVLRDKFKAPASVEILIGIPELIERVHILDSRLEPKVLEILKYYLQGKAEETEPEADINVYFGTVIEDRLQFRISGFKSGETGLVHVPMAKYNEVKSDLNAISRKAPFKSVFSGPYQSFRKAAFLEDGKR